MTQTISAEVKPGSITPDDLRNHTDILDILESNEDDIRFFVSAAQAPFSLRNWNFKFSDLGEDGLGRDEQLFLAAAYRR